MEPPLNYIYTVILWALKESYHFIYHQKVCTITITALYADGKIVSQRAEIYLGTHTHK